MYVYIKVKLGDNCIDRLTIKKSMSNLPLSFDIILMMHPKPTVQKDATLLNSLWTFSMRLTSIEFHLVKKVMFSLSHV